jgi:hypothetical protein
MKANLPACGLLFSILSLALTPHLLYAVSYPKQPTVVKLEGAKMAPVTFSHTTHMEKAKVPCAKCHHKDAQDPKMCDTCHMKETKGKTLAAKDAFHAQCQACHKEATGKGSAAPTKCNDCHKK